MFDYLYTYKSYDIYIKSDNDKSNVKIQIRKMNMIKKKLDTQIFRNVFNNINGIKKLNSLIDVYNHLSINNNTDSYYVAINTPNVYLINPYDMLYDIIYDENKINILSRNDKKFVNNSYERIQNFTCEISCVDDKFICDFICPTKFMNIDYKLAVINKVCDIYEIYEETNTH